MEDVADPPAIAFSTTPIGTTSTDSPQTVSLTNTGTSALSFSIPASGNNPAISPNFTWNSSGSAACPVTASSASSPGNLAAQSTCALPISFTPAGLGALSGQLSITDNNLNGTNVIQNILLSGTANQASTTTGIAANATDFLVGQMVTLTATITTPSTEPPTGTVSFYNGAILLGTGTLSGNIATFSSQLPSGSYIITASYSGDGNFTSSISSPQTISVEDFSIAGAGSGNQTVAAGQSAAFALNLASTSSTFSFLVTLSATGLPPGATATFTPATVMTGTSSTTLNMTVSTGNTNSMLRRGGLGTFVFALLALPLSMLSRRRLFRGLLPVLLLAATLGISGCGSGAHQPTSNYIITVLGTAQSGSTEVQRSTTVTLIVQ